MITTESNFERVQKVFSSKVFCTCILSILKRKENHFQCKYSKKRDLQKSHILKKGLSFFISNCLHPYSTQTVRLHKETYMPKPHTAHAKKPKCQENTPAEDFVSLWSYHSQTYINTLTKIAQGKRELFNSIGTVEPTSVLCSLQ